MDCARIGSRERMFYRKARAQGLGKLTNRKTEEKVGRGQTCRDLRKE